MKWPEVKKGKRKRRETWAVTTLVCPNSVLSGRAFTGPYWRGIMGFFNMNLFFLKNTPDLILKIIKPQTFSENLLFSWPCAIFSAQRNIRICNTTKTFPQEANGLVEKKLLTEWGGQQHLVLSDQGLSTILHLVPRWRNWLAKFSEFLLLLRIQWVQGLDESQNWALRLILREECSSSFYKGK